MSEVFKGIEAFILKKYKPLLIIAVAFLFYQVITTHLNGNLQLLFGEIFQVDYLSGDFFSKLYHSYGRGIGYRFVLYALYSVNTAFLGDWDYNYSYVFVKLVYYIFFFSLSYFFFFINKAKLKSYGIKINTAFLIFMFVSLLSTHRQTLEASEVAYFLSIGMVSFAVSSNKYLNYLSGLFAFFLISLKGITLGFAGFPFLFLLYNYRKDSALFWRFVTSCFVFVVLTVLFYVYVIPLEVEMYLDQSVYQTAFRFKATTVPLFFFSAIKSLSCVPNTFIVYALLSYYFVDAYKKIPLKKLFVLLAFMLFVPFVYVVIQHKWFPYNYVVFLPLVLFSMVFLNVQYSAEKLKRLLLVVFSASLFIYVISFLMPSYKLSSMFVSYCNKCNYEQEYYTSDKDIALYLRDKYDLDSQEELLNLTPGLSSYYIRTKSYFKEVNLLVLQRFVKIPDLDKTEQFRKTLSKLLQYQGEYILLDSVWFDLSLFPSIEAKLAKEYGLVETKPSFEGKVINLYKKK